MPSENGPRRILLEDDDVGKGEGVEKAGNLAVYLQRRRKSNRTFRGVFHSIVSGREKYCITIT